MTPQETPKNTSKALKNNNVKARSGAAKGTVRATAVKAYLQANPDFLVRHKALLEGLMVPRKAGNVLSLHAAKAEKADKNLETLKKRYRQLISAAAANAATTAAVHDAVEILVAADSRAELGKALLGPFRQILGLSVARVLWGPEHAPAQLLTLGPVGLEHKDMFGIDTARLKSCALLRLETREGEGVGLLALASEDAAHFHAGHGTDLLEFLRRIGQMAIIRVYSARP